MSDYRKETYQTIYNTKVPSIITCGDTSYCETVISDVQRVFDAGVTYTYKPPPSPPLVVYNYKNYTFTIYLLGEGCVTWSYKYMNNSLWNKNFPQWSQDFTLSEKRILELPYGTYEIGEIIFRNKLSNGISSKNLIGNNFKIVRRPGYPTVVLNPLTGVITFEKFGEGAIMWKYSIDGGISWSDDNNKTGDFKLPPGTYPIGTISIMNFSSDYTSTFTPVINKKKVVSIVTNYDEYVENISGIYPLSYPPQWVPEPDDNPENMVKFPFYTDKYLVVKPTGKYVSWEYSINTDYTQNKRIWIISDKDANTVIIEPGYYPAFMIAVKLYRSNGTYTVIFNNRDIELFPETPEIEYIGDGLIKVFTSQSSSTWQYKLTNRDDKEWKMGTSSLLKLPIGNYPIGSIQIRSIIDDIIASEYIKNDTVINVTDENYDNNILYDDWITSTIIKTPTIKGTKYINVYNTEGFKIKGKIIIGYGENSEINVVSGFGSLLLKNPLKGNYPAGTIVRGYDINEYDIFLEKENQRIQKEKDFIYNNFYPKFSKSLNRLKCYKHIVNPENSTIKTCQQEKSPVWIVGDKSSSIADSKINRIKKSVLRNKSGKIVYGENGLSSPFLPADTNENTKVSKFYRCNIPNNIPIINGLRGGIVPIKMRTNKF